MKQKSTPFFVKLKRAVMNFEEYKNFSEEKLSMAFKYIIKLMLLFTLIVSVSLVYKFIDVAESEIKYFNDNFPQFKIENNILTIEGENKQYIRGDEARIFWSNCK